MDPEHWAIVDKKNPPPRGACPGNLSPDWQDLHFFPCSREEAASFPHHQDRLNRDRAELYDRINQRVLMMMEEGLEAEARSVYPHKGLTALRTVGYKEMFAYFDGEIEQG